MGIIFGFKPAQAPKSEKPRRHKGVKKPTAVVKPNEAKIPKKDTKEGTECHSL